MTVSPISLWKHVRPSSTLIMDEMQDSPREISVLGFRLNPLTGDEVTAAIGTAVERRQRLVMANLNTHAMARMFENPFMAGLLAQDDARVMLDSMPILFMANLGGHRLPRAMRTTSLDFYDAMFRLGVTQGWKFGFVGATPQVLAAGLDILRARTPGLQISGRPGFFDINDDRPGSVQTELVAWLNAESHDVLIVGMGMPRQEEWTAKVQHRIDTRVFLMAGAYLDYQVGVQRPAPRWLGQIGIEWAYRLLLSPRRLGYRYLVEPMVLLTRLLTRNHPQSAWRKANAGRKR